LAAGTEVGKYRFLVLLLPLYTRLNREKVLDNELRGMIRGFIAADPGIHLNELLHRLRIGNGAAVHHLLALEREGIIRSRRDGPLKRFYPGEMRTVDMPLRLSGLQKLILETVQRQEGLSQVRIASLIDASYLTVHRHINKMAEMGVLRLERSGMGTRCYLAENGTVASAQQSKP
jgi:predicted transcriptional regulator